MSADPKMKPSEQLSRDILSAYLDVDSIDVRDRNCGSSVHDFDLLKAGAVVGAVEVTEDRDPHSARWQSLQTDTAPPSTVPVPGCQHGWAISLGRAPEFPDKWAVRELAPFLRKFEDRRVDRAHFLEGVGRPTGTVIVPSREFPPWLGTLPPALAELDVAAIGHTRDIPPGRARLHLMRLMPTRHPDHLADWLQRFVASERCAGERNKLARSGLPSRHLAIVINFSPESDWTVHTSLQEVRYKAAPTLIPRLPVEITDVWLLTDYPGTPSLHVDANRWTELPPHTPYST